MNSSVTMTAAMAAVTTLCLTTGVPAQSIDGETGPLTNLRGDLSEVVRTADAGEMIPITIVLRDRVSRAEIQALTAGFDRLQRRPVVVPRLKASFAQTSGGLLDAVGVEVAAGSAGNVRQLWIVGAVALSATPGAIDRLSKHADVEWISYDRPVGEEIFPVMPSFDDGAPQAGGPAQGGSIECGTANMNAPDVWTTHGITGSGVVVGVIDTGCCVTHPDLSDHIWNNPGEIAGNGVDDDSNGYTDDIIGWNFRDGTNDPFDDNSHGTHVSGTVLGDGTNGLQTGIAPDASLMSLKMWNNFSGESIVWEAMQYGVENGADVFSVSLGWPDSVDPDRVMWRTACEAAIDAGVVVVYAAGNSGACCGLDSVTYPGNVPDVITAGAIDCNEFIAGFSGRGPVTWEDIAPFNDWPFPPGKMKPTVVAGGVDTQSTSFNCSGYAPKSGTSMATPHIAGACALILEANPALDHYDVKQILKDTATDLGSAGHDNDYGAGHVNALAAVEAALASGDPADLDGDGSVGFSDLLMLLAAWGPCPGCDADLDGDGFVGFSDLLIMLASWS